jgi:hypothetical protein
MLTIRKMADDTELIPNPVFDLKQMIESSFTNRYGLTAEQYHTGLTKLWDALELEGVQQLDVFTLASERIEHLTERLEAIAFHGTDMPAALNCDEAAWWKSIAHDCMRIARRGLDAK